MKDTSRFVTDSLQGIRIDDKKISVKDHTETKVKVTPSSFRNRQVKGK